MRIRGFTMIELLIVISIIGLLAGMMMPLVSLSGRAARKSATHSVMVKTETAIRLFRSEIGSYPWQRTYADLSAGESWTNRLWYHLGGKIDGSQLAKIQQDADTAAGHYAYDTTFAEPTTPLIYREGSLLPAWKWVSSWGAYADPPWLGGGTAALANRMAQERARLAVFSGNIDVCGTKKPAVISPTNVIKEPARDFSAIKLITTPASNAAPGPGWANDYLKGELDKRYAVDQAINDAWGRPLLYVCQVTEGVSGTFGRIQSSEVVSFQVEWLGLQRQGRKILTTRQNDTGAALPADPARLPDPMNLMRSDRRSYAAPAYEYEFELWSAGPDGRAEWMRDAAVNRDNVSLQPYDKAILP